MADKKISALTGATTPLAGTEVLPIVQGGATVKVAVSDLTAGRAVSATQLTSTVAIGTAPLVVTSTTNVANLNASSLNGATFAAPGAIGGGTAAAGSFTTVSATGDITSTTGNLVVSNGKGIDFSATPGTGTSELLADYEEGTWTPAITLGGGSVTYTTQTGTYTKIGRLVTVQLNIAVNVATTPSSTFEITGLPFTVSATAKGSTSAPQLDAWAVTLTGTLVGAATPSTTKIRMYELSAGSLANPGAKVASGCTTQLMLSYEV